MAISANAVWEIRANATASNVNGGFFVTGATGTDYSQQTAAQYAALAITSGGATAVMTTASAAADMVGNGIKVLSGTNATVGWYEIISVVAGVSITVDRNWCSGACADGSSNIGGAMSLQHTTDDAVFENAVAGNKFWVKQANYTLGSNLTIAAAGTATVAILMEGYATARGDKPTGATRPTFTLFSNTTITMGANWKVSNMMFTTTATDTFVCMTTGNANVFTDCKATHIGVNANRAAWYCNADTVLIRCEGVNALGLAVNASGGNQFIGCYFHDSNIGVALGSTTLNCFITDCIFDTCATTALDFQAAATGHQLVYGNTFYGAETPAGTGIKLIAGCTDVRIINNIIYGFVTGVSHGTAGQTMGVDMYNAYYNNTTNGTNWTLGVGSTTSAITFAGAVAGDFTPTSSNVIGTGIQGTFPAGLSTGYADIGAVQKQYGSGQAAGAGGGFPTFTI